MKNKWTTVTGVLALIGAVCLAAVRVMNGEPPNVESIIAALTGLGLLKASDGSL